MRLSIKSHKHTDRSHGKPEIPPVPSSEFYSPNLRTPILENPSLRSKFPEKLPRGNFLWGKFQITGERIVFSKILAIQLVTVELKHSAIPMPAPIAYLVAPKEHSAIPTAAPTAYLVVPNL